MMDDLEQVMDLISGIGEDGSAGFLRSELERKLGCSRNKAMRIIRDLRDAGTIEPAMVRRVDAWGIGQSYKGYVLVAQKKGA